MQGGYGALQSFSEVQNVELSYNEDGELVDRGEVEGGLAIRSLLEDDWGFPIVESDLDPDDPLVNSATEYMYQMATISYHTLHGPIVAPETLVRKYRERLSSLILCDTKASADDEAQLVLDDARAFVTEMQRLLAM